MKDKVITVSFFAGLANLVVSLAAYDNVDLSRKFAAFGLIFFLAGLAVMLISEFWHRKRTRCAGKPNESQKVESNKDLTVIIHRINGAVKAGDRP